MINMKNLVDMMVIVVLVIGKFAHFNPKSYTQFFLNTLLGEGIKNTLQ